MPSDTLYIDVDEEITSVIDKLKETGEKVVLLAVPKGATLLQSVVNLKLLKKEAEDQGKEIALVTSDPVGQNLASRVGLPVYQDVEGKELVTPRALPEKLPSEETIEVDMSGREDSRVAVHHYQGGETLAQPTMRATRRFPRKKFLIGLAIFLASLIGLLFLYPRTTVVLGVASEPYESNIELTIDKNVTELAANSSILPGTAIEKENEKTTTAQATGKKTVGEKATGTATISNCYQSVPLSLSSGTSLTSSGKSFITTTAVTIPAATIIGASCTAAGQGNVAIEAAAVGSDSNLGASATFCVANYPCSGGTYVKGENGSALSGGSSKDITFLKQEDIDAASNSAKDELIASTIGEVKQEAEAKSLRVLEAALDQQVASISSDKPAGTEANDAQVVTKVRVRTLAFREEDYRSLIVNLLSLRLPEGKRLILSADDEISTTVTESNWDEGFVKITGDVKTNMAEAIDEGQVKQLVKNKSQGKAQSKLLELPGVVEANVSSIPRLFNRTALFTRNITVTQEAK